MTTTKSKPKLKRERWPETDTYTVSELAAEIGASREAVQKRARQLGARKVGKTYVLTLAQAYTIRDALADPEKAGPAVRSQVTTAAAEPAGQEA